MAINTVLLVLVLVVVLSSGASASPLDNPRTGRSIPLNLIVDVDPGFDDAWALFLLLRADQNTSANLRIIAIMTVHGNTHVDNGLRNVNRILETAQVRGIPVYSGAETALVTPWVEEPPYFGEDGFGDAGLPPVQCDWSQPGHAVDKIVELARAYPGQLTFLALGPLTNLALAINKAPDIRDKFVRIVVLGGNYLGYGSMTPTAGFNFFTDVEAAHVVLERYTTPKLLIPLETRRAYARLPRDFRVNILGGLNTRQVQLMNRVEAEHLGKNGTTWTASDALAAAISMEPRLVKKVESYYGTVELSGKLTREMVVVERRSGKGRAPNANFVTEVDQELYKRMLVTAAGGRWYEI